MSKSQYIIIGVLILVAFATGRFMTPEKVKIEKQVVTVEVEKKDRKKDTDEHKTIVEKINPDGSKETTTIVDTHTKSDTSVTREQDKKETESKLVEKGSGPTVGLMLGIDIMNPAKGFVPGAQVTIPVLGPIVFGAWGMTNGMGGVFGGIKF